MKQITDFLKNHVPVVKEYKKRRGNIGDVIAVYGQMHADGFRVRDYFAKIIKIIEEDGVFLHYLEKLPELTHSEKMKRINKKK